MFTWQKCGKNMLITNKQIAWIVSELPAFFLYVLYFFLI